MLFFVKPSWGQSGVLDEGLYYIKIYDVLNGTTTPIYLWRAITEKTAGQPYLSGWNATTFNETVNGQSYSFDQAHCTWIVKQVTVGSNTYNTLMNVATEQYVVWDTYNNGTAKAVHLETRTSAPTSSNDKCFFVVYTSGTDLYIHPDQCSTTTRGLNYKGNFKTTDLLCVRDGNGRGLIQFYDDTKNDKINITNATEVPSPTINFDEVTGTYTITTTLPLTGNYKIRYTEDGSDPDINSQEYTPGSTIHVVQENTLVKAIVTGYGMVLTLMDTKEVSPPSVHPDTPTFNVTCEDELEIKCNNMPLADIYYTYTDGSTDPATPSNDLSNPDNYLYEGSISDFSDGYKVKAIAYNGDDSSDVSEVYTFMTNNAPPTLTIESNRVKVEFAEGQTIHFTTVDGTRPDPTQPGQSTSPYYIDGFSESSDLYVGVITTSTDATDGRGPSCPVTEIRRPKKPTVNIVDDCGENGERSQVLTFTGMQDGRTYWYALSNGQNQTAPELNTFRQYTGPVNIVEIPEWDQSSVWVTLHAYAKDADGHPSVVVSQNYLLKHTEAPVITYETGESEATVTINAVPGATIQYSVDGGSWQTYLEPFGVLNNYTYTVIAKAKLGNEGESCEVTKIVRLPKPISSLTEIDDANGAYDLTANIDDASSFTGFSSTFGDFTGSLNGNNHTISKLKVPLFNVINGGTVNNLFFDNVEITTGNDNGNVGTVCCEAKGASRIYNCGVLATNSTVTTDADGYTMITSCSSTISGSNYVGGLVGLLDGSSRVINCFSYANITGGNLVGGIVGYNNYATTSETNKLKTMVMNCMFYGDITGGNSKAPIYNGKKISNAGNKGVSNFNYFWYGASYVQNKHIDVYNCDLAAETRFLQRFEFFRHLLNSNRALAAWWATGSRDNKDEMLKWVMEPTQIGTSTPYPILKTPGKYPSVVNYDAEHALENQPRNQGGKLGTLSVTIQMGSGGAQFGPPTGAAITSSSLTLPILDKDTTHFNYNYYKVQLPYYNAVGSKNYTGNRVVTGWKIVGITGGTQGSYSTGSDVTFTNGEVTATPYNFADRHCTDKDLYSVSGRVFNQGAYWDVPEGVTAITIEPYWAKAAYVADAFADVVYNTDMSTKYDVPGVGGGNIYVNGTNYTIAGSSQIVYTSISDAIASSALAPNSSHTVNDYAVVLIGNCHQYNGIEASKPYTLTSIDLDHDNEPDYALILSFERRMQFHPVKYDFVTIIGSGMAQKSTGGKGTYNLGIPQPLGWFEATNTSLFRVTQFEFDRSNRTEQPIILQGGVMEQWVTGQSNGGSNKTIYYHVGGNVWFKEFHIGCHQDVLLTTKHPPISVTGGDFDAFYLTGLYSNAPNFEDDAECYINGGRFGTMAGTGMEGIGKTSDHSEGNITWLIDNADIKEFYAGGINAAKIAEGNLYTGISNSHVRYFYGGPKFGDMNNDRTVKTVADNCTFGYFFGAGYGGNSYYTAAPGNYTNDGDPWIQTDGNKGFNLDWDKWVTGEKPGTTVNHGNYKFITTGSAYEIPYTGYHRDYITEFGGVSTAIDYQFLPFSNNKTNVGRLFLKFVRFSLATTRSIRSTLTGCTIEHNFYGGGSIGKVEGDVVSILDGCTVNGDVFGAGYSATIPKVPVMDRGGFKAHEQGQEYPYYQPYYDKNLGVYLPGVFPNTVDYTWVYDPENHPVTSTETAVDTTNHILYTTVNLDKRELGSVKGDVTLTIKGNSMVFGSVFGGGEESLVVKPENNTDKGNTEVQILGKTKVLGNIYGGGNMGEVEGNTKVIVNGDNDSGSGGSGGGGN